MAKDMASWLRLRNQMETGMLSDRELAELMYPDAAPEQGVEYDAIEPETKKAPQGPKRRFDGHWVRTPEGLKFVEDKSWVES